MQAERHPIIRFFFSLQPSDIHQTPRTPKHRRRPLDLALVLALLPALAFCFGCGSSLVGGTVSTTNNPQVALYTVTTHSGAQVTIHFGLTTNYGLVTSTKSIPSNGGSVSIYVAGMKGNSTYHMQAEVKLSDGRTVSDVDHVFHTSTYPANYAPAVTAAAAPGQTPQPGIQMVNTTGSTAQITAFDLSGNLLWAYNDPTVDLSHAFWLAPSLMPNGDFIAIVSPSSSIALKGGAPAGTPDIAREFDLAGNTVKQITMDQLNTELAAKNFNLTLDVFSHEIIVLPNGHWVVLATTLKDVVLSGQTTPTQVLGDAIVDLDENLQPVWAWNEFDHLDVNRRPWKFPDWTHTNAIIYSPDDGNLLVSIRHQNWIVKVDYADGTGTGNILWRLGAGGDFKLIGGTDPTDWAYAQHGMHFTTQNTAGRFGLVVMDNGDDRSYPGDDPAAPPTCGGDGSVACYTTVPMYEIDEAAKTATLQFHQVAPRNLYSAWGGNAEELDNGNVEYDLCGLPGPNSQIDEVTNEANPQTVWTMKLSGNSAYRSYRLPSFYPGVQW